MTTEYVELKLKIEYLRRNLRNMQVRKISIEFNDKIDNFTFRFILL